MIKVGDILKRKDGSEHRVTDIDTSNGDFNAKNSRGQDWWYGARGNAWLGDKPDPDNDLIIPAKRSTKMIKVGDILKRKDGSEHTVIEIDEDIFCAKDSNGDDWWYTEEGEFHTGDSRDVYKDLIIPDRKSKRCYGNEKNKSTDKHMKVKDWLKGINGISHKSLRCRLVYYVDEPIEIEQNGVSIQISIEEAEALRNWLTEIL